MATRKLVVEVVGDATSLDRAFKRASASARSFGRDIGRSGLGKATSTISSGFSSLARSLPVVGAGLAGVGFALGKSVEAASDLNEAMAQTGVVFGRAAGEVQDWSQTTAASFGIARTEALQTAAGFGALLQPLGVMGREASRQSRALTELGADLASFYNTDVRDSLDAIRSALVGEAEPLRRYGVLLSETRVQAEAMAQTGKRTAASLTNQEKALARIAIIFRDTAVAQGDFARTSDGLANQNRILTAQIRDAAAQIGQALLPVVLDVTERFNEWLSQPENIRKITAAVEDAVAVMQTFADAVGDIIDAFRELDAFLNQFWRDLKTEAFNAFLDIIEPFSHLPDRAGQWARDLKVTVLRELGEIEDAAARAAGTLAPLSDVASSLARNRDSARSGARSTPRRTSLGALAPAAAGVARATSEAIRNAAALPFREFQLAVAEGTKTLADDLRVLRTIITVLTGRLARATTLKAKTEIVNALNQYRQQEAALIRGMAEARRQLTEARRQRESQRRENRQFGLLGLGPGGAELPPTLKNLRASLGRITDAVKGTFLDTGKTRSLLQNIRKLLSGSLGKLSEDVRRTIKDLLDDIDRQLREHASGPRTKFRVLSTAALTEGLGLTEQQRKELRQRLARRGAGGTVPSAGPSAFGVPIGQPGQGRGGRGGRTDDRRPQVINLVVDGKILAQVVTNQLQQQGRARARSSRGRYGGMNHGLT